MMTTIILASERKDVNSKTIQFWEYSWFLHDFVTKISSFEAI